MKDEDTKDIGGLFAELFGPDGGFLLWSRNPKRGGRDGDGMRVATDTKDNPSIHVTPKQALLLLEYLTDQKERFEKAIIEDALGRFRHYP